MKKLMFTRMVLLGAILINLSCTFPVLAEVLSYGHIELLKKMQARSNKDDKELNLWIAPAKVTYAKGEPSVEGFFLVLTAPKEKLYWWKFGEGSYLANNKSFADNIMKSCQPYMDKHSLLVFCTGSMELVIAHTKKKYTDESVLLDLVIPEFNIHTVKREAGFDYYNKRLNLINVLGDDFFYIKPHYPISIDQIGLGEIKPVGNGWEVVVIGANNTKALLKLSSDFTLKETKRLQ